MTKKTEKTADERKADLKAELDKMGVEYDGRSSEDALKEMLANAKQKSTKAPEGAPASGGMKPGLGRARAERHGSKVPSVRVVIAKDETTSIPRRVFEHEVPVLQTLWGEDRVKVLEGSEVDMELGGDAAYEFERMLRVYGRKGENAVRAVYHNPGSLADELGIAAPRARSTRSRLTASPQHGARGAGVI